MNLSERFGYIPLAIPLPNALNGEIDTSPNTVFDLYFSGIK